MDTGPGRAIVLVEAVASEGGIEGRGGGSHGWRNEGMDTGPGRAIVLVEAVASEGGIEGRGGGRQVEEAD